MNNYKKMLILMMFLSSIFCGNASFADEQNEAMFEMLQNGGKALGQLQFDNLKRYNNWWNSLSPKQKQIALSVDRIEENFKLRHNGKPIIKNYDTVATMAYTLGLRASSYDLAIVDARMQQHMDDYNDLQKIEQLSSGYEKLKKKIQDTPKQ